MQAESGLTSKAPAQLAEARQWFEDRAESYCGVAFVTRFARDVLDGSGGDSVYLSHLYPRSVLSAKVEGIAQTGTATWDLYESGLVVRDTGFFAWGHRNVEITYEHGLEVVESEIREAALVATRAKLLSDSGGGSIPAGVTQLITDAGTYNFGRPSVPFGIPEVDQVLGMHRVLPVG